MFVCLFVFFLSSRRVRFESVTALKLWNLIFGWARYKTEHRVDKVCCSKCFIVFFISFLVYFDKKVHKKLEKKLSKQKNAKPWILLNQTRTEKQMRAVALRHMIYFFSPIISQCSKNYGSSTRLTRLKVEPNTADPISRNEKRP